jgi:nicotinate-nucleotide adenylyltransferase
VPGVSQRIVPLPMPTVDIRSTALRERARAGLSLRYLVPLAVEEYVRRHGLYGPS